MTHIKDPISSLTHFIGIILSVLALILLINKGLIFDNSMYIASLIVFGISLILLYSASTIYHAVGNPIWLSNILHKIDHMMIFVLIAGTYTPICIIALKGIVGLSIFIVIWTAAILGILFKIFWMNAPRFVYTGIYVAMGWIIIIAIFPLYNALPSQAIIWLVLGGILYTLGAVLYATKWPKIATKWFGFHEIFHIFVLLGSLCHFLMIYNYVIYVK